jgi:hypothetical protein
MSPPKQLIEKAKAASGWTDGFSWNTIRLDSHEGSLRQGDWMCAAAHAIKDLQIPNLNVPHAQPQQKMAQN